MDKVLIEEKTFREIDGTAFPLITGDYEQCSFINCDFSGSSFAHCAFTECTFIECNISTVNLTKTAFRDCKFSGCKLMGLHFQDTNPIGLAVDFDHCILNLSSFYQLKLKNTVFKNCSLIEADFAATDLTAAIFDQCNLAGAIFENTILEKADLCTSFNFNIDPEMNRIKKAKFSTASLAGLLHRYDIVIE